MGMQTYAIFLIFVIQVKTKKLLSNSNRTIYHRSYEDKKGIKSNGGKRRYS